MFVTFLLQALDFGIGSTIIAEAGFAAAKFLRRVLDIQEKYHLSYDSALAVYMALNHTVVDTPPSARVSAFITQNINSLLFRLGVCQFIFWAIGFSYSATVQLIVSGASIGCALYFQFLYGPRKVAGIIRTKDSLWAAYNDCMDRYMAQQTKETT